MAAPAFKRVLLKLSGEALMGELPYGTDPERVRAIAGQVHDMRSQGVEVAIVVGAGNIFRGMKGAADGMDRARTRWRRPARRCGCRARLRSPRSPSPTSAAARCAIWRRAGS
jgi:hypothetical protein